MTRESARVDSERCIGCGLCARVCPAGAAALEGAAALIDPRRCGACYKCVARCPVRALSVR